MRRKEQGAANSLLPSPRFVVWKGITFWGRGHGMIVQEFERLVLHGLCCEWQGAAMELRSSERKGLVQPLFAIRDLKGMWGTWYSERREISLSSDLVCHHPWDAVREVLLHEMAHQFADQVLHSENEPPHGPTFQKACRLLRANPKASGNLPLLDQRLSDDFSQGQEKVLVRIRKLMALAQSANRHEAEAAMDKAHELMRRHQLDLITGPENREFVSTFVGKPALRHFREHYRLSNLLQDFYFVYGVWVPAYVVEKGRMGRVLEITGRIQNVKIASYVHLFVMRFIDARWNDYTRRKKLHRHRKTDFAVGILEGFRKRLRDRNRKPADPAESAGLSLMRVEDRELKKEMAYRYPRLRQIRGKIARRDEKVLRDGIRIGRDLVVYKGIEARGGKERNRLLLPGETDST